MGSKTARRSLAVLITMLAVSICINYVDRGNISTAAPLLKNELKLSATQLGFLFTAFFVTYALVQFVAGWLVDRFGAYRTLLAGFFVWSLATALTGFASAFTTIFALRLALGAGESVAFPSYSQIISRCVDEERRGFVNGTIMAAMALGPALGIFFGGHFMAIYGWRPFFVGFGVLSLLWILPWALSARKCLARTEQAIITTGPSLRDLLGHHSLWGSSIASFCGVYAWYFILTWIPYYLVHERHWSMSGMATIGGICYLFVAIAMMTSGSLADLWIRKGATPTIARKTFLGGALVIVSFSMIGCAFAGTFLSVVFLIVGAVAWGVGSAHVFAVCQTLAGSAAAGRWVGFQNGVAAFSGIIAPALTGILVDRTGNFVLPFVAAAIVTLCGAGAWVFLVGPIKTIDWTQRREVVPVVAGATS